MTFQQCKYVIEIAKAGSFNEAATNLFVSQASLSESVKNLEKELSIKIFERSNKGINLTIEGLEFIKYAGQLVSQAEFIKERYSKASYAKRLNISTQHYDFAAEVFADFVNKVSESELTLQLKETKTYEVIDDVKNFRSDLGIIAMKKNSNLLMERYLKKNKIKFTVLAEVAPHIFLRKNHPLSRYSELNYDDLEEYPYVFYEQGEKTAVQFSEELTDNTKFKKRIEINDRATLLNLILSTDCVTIGTGIMTSELNSGNIISVRLKSDEIYCIGWITRENTELTSEADMFIKMLDKFINAI